jgi:DNA-binding NarL/FixJ family response regulator
VKKNFKILLVDDHPMILEAYKSILSSLEMSADYRFIIHTADNCDSGIKKIEYASNKRHYDILFLDINLPPSLDGEIISGEGLAGYAREMLPKARIVILTMFNEYDRLHNILNTVSPDGLLVKNDVTLKEFLVAFDVIMNNPPYYSATVKKYFGNKLGNQEEQLLDEINRKILYHLSKGIKTKNLTNYINLSLSAIEKRKTQIRGLFELEKANDEKLIEEAKSRGFV